MAAMLKAVYLFSWLCSPMVVCRLVRSVCPGIHPVLLYGITIVATFLVWLVPYWAVNFYYERELWKYDINGDGQLSDSEFSADTERASWRLIADTGRQFYALLGVPATLIWVTINFPFIQMQWENARESIGEDGPEKNGSLFRQPD